LKRQRIRYADWSVAEYGAALRCLIKGRIARGPAPARLAARLAAQYAPATVYPLNFAHTGLAIALALFRARRPGRDEIVVPDYICPSVVQTVEAAGLRAIPAAIGADLNLTVDGVRAVLGERTLAVVAPHMFGSPAPIAAIETLCRAAGVFLVDDAAQVVGEAVGGRLLGTFGDVGLISFAQSKAVVTGVGGSGGVLLVNNADLDGEVRAVWQALPAPRGRLRALLDFLWNYQWQGWTGTSGYYFRRLGERLGWKRPAPQPARIANLDAAIALVQLARLPRLRSGRIACAQAYRAALPEGHGIGFPQYAPGRYLSRVMLSLPPATDLDALRAHLVRAGVETRLGYQTRVRPDCPDEPATAAARRLLGLPFSADLDERTIKEICNLLINALKSLPSIPPLPIQNNEASHSAL
jgi:dTDP-4-amino-4,6-dideoxygalactose transaminase